MLKPQGGHEGEREKEEEEMVFIGPEVAALLPIEHMGGIKREEN
jgi:hypothetical protein